MTIVLRNMLQIKDGVNIGKNNYFFDIMRIVTFILFMFILFLTSCNFSEKNQNTLLDEMFRVDTCSFSPSFLREIKKYVTDCKSANVFILKSTMLYEYSDYTDNPNNEVYAISPASLSNSVGRGEFYFVRDYPVSYFEVNNKIVLLSSSMDKWTNQKKMKKIYTGLKGMCNDEESQTKEKKYFFVWYTKDSTKVTSERNFMLNNKLTPIIEQHKSLDTTFSAPKIK